MEIHNNCYNRYRKDIGNQILENSEYMKQMVQLKSRTRRGSVLCS